VNPSWIVVGIALATLAAQVVGFVYLTRNHLAHIQKSLDDVLTLLRDHERRISTMEGRLE
jgi:hypothetical protein